MAATITQNVARNIAHNLLVIIITGFMLVACASEDSLAPETGAVPAPPENGSSQIVANAPDAVVGQGIEVTNEATLTNVAIDIDQQVTVTVQGTLPDSCLSVDRINLALNGNAFALAVATLRQIDVMCTAQPQPFQETATLPIAGLAAGTYAVSVNGSNVINTSFTLTDAMVQSLANPILEQTGATIEGIVWNDTCQIANNTPLAGCVVAENGSFQANGSFDNGESRIEGVEVALLAGQCPGTEPLAFATTDQTGLYRLTGLQPGLYCVTVDAALPANVAIFTSGGWTYPNLNTGSATLSLTGEDYQTADFGWSFQPTTQPAPQPTAPILVENSPTCLNEAAFIADVTIPDDTILAPGEAFIKTWRMRNQGDCTWGPAYRLVFDGGDLMNGPTAVPFTQVVEPGQEVDLSVALVAPPVAGSYRGDWKIQDPAGVTFGSQGDYAFYVQIIVSADASLAPAQSQPVVTAIQGMVWQDYCGVLSDGSPSGGCIMGSNSAYQANGIFDADESVLAGISINLSRGNCGNGQVLATTTSGPDGVYRFAELEAGTYCLIAMPPVQSGGSILASGRWTYPGVGLGYTTIVVEAGKVSPADFGWSYWLQ